MIDVRDQGGETHLAIEEFEARVRDGRIPPDAELRFAPVTGEAWVRADELELYRDLARQIHRASTRLADLDPPILTALLLGINIRIWWLGNAADGGYTVSSQLTDWLAPMLIDGQSYRALTMGVAHTDFGHILTNMLWFALSSALIERVLGRANLLAIFAGSVLAGGLASAWFAPMSASLGASGGVFGLIGALVVFGLRHDELLTRRQRQFFGWAMVPYVAYMLYSGTQSEGTDNYAHFFGFFAGVAICFAVSPHDPRHNRRVHAAMSLSSIAVLGLMAIWGPQIYPTWDSAVASRRILERHAPDAPIADTEDDFLHYRVPAGWLRGAAPSGAAGFRAPEIYEGDSLGFGVEHDENARLTDIDALTTSLQATLSRAFPEVTFGEAESVVLAGREARAIRADLGNGRVVLWQGTTRGVQTLEATFWVDTRREARVEPLRQRLLKTVRWEDPPELADARRAAEQTPGPSTTRRLAKQLARIGAIDEARPLLEAALQDSSTSSEARSAAWVSLLEITDIAGEEPPIEAALADASVEIVLAVANLVDSEDRRRGLLDLAGRQWPADKDLRKARLRAGLTARRDKETGLPWHLAHESDGQRRTPEAIEELAQQPLDLESADRAALWLEEQDAHALDLALNHPAVRLQALSFIKYRYIPADLETARGKLTVDLSRAAQGRAPSWMPTAIVAAATDPAFAASIAAP